MTIKELLENFQEKPVAYHRIYAKITGGITAGILLSQILYWDLIMKHKEFFKTDKEFCDELSMGLYELKGAKKKLLDLDLITTNRKGVPAKTYYKVNLDQLISMITSYGKNPQLVMGKTTNKLLEKPTTIYTENTTKNNTDTSNSKELQSNIKSLISYWKTINPVYKTWYNNTTQRKACEFLLTDEGVNQKQLAYIVKNLDTISNMEFCPNITTPHMLMKNFSRVVTLIKQNQADKKKACWKIS